MDYKPTLIPLGVDPQVSEFLQRELSRLSTILDEERLNTPILKELHAEPQKVLNGMLALADGTNWNPGSGRGVYWYDLNATAWKFLG